MIHKDLKVSKSINHIIHADFKVGQTETLSQVDVDAEEICRWKYRTYRSSAWPLSEE